MKSNIIRHESMGNYTYYHILMNIEMKERGAAEVARLLQGLPPIFFGSLKYDNDYI